MIKIGPGTIWGIRSLVASLLVVLTLPANSLLGQDLILEGQKSIVSVKFLRDRPFIDADWFPVMLTIDNKSQTKSGTFVIQMKNSGADEIDSLHWQATFEVPAGQELKRLVGLPLSWNWYTTWNNNMNLDLSATRDGDALSLNGKGRTLSTNYYMNERKHSEGSLYKLVLLEVTPSTNQSGESFDWRAFTRHAGPVADGKTRAGNILFETNNLIVGSEVLPQNREALLGVDIVLLHGIDPEDLSIGQRQALIGAVEGGLLVVLRPDEKGRGLRWLPGISIEPLIELDAEGKERVRFPVLSRQSQRLTSDCVSVAQGLGRWLVLEKANGPWQLPSAAGLRHPWHLGSARARLESGYPLQQFLEALDVTQRPGNPLRLILILGLFYICVLWPVIGARLKATGKLPHMLWLQPMVGASCILIVFVLSTFRLGVLPRLETEALLVRFPGENHGVLYLIDSSYTPIGGRTDFAATASLPALPLAVGASTKNHTLRMAEDGTTQVFSDRKIRTTSHHVRCDVIEVTPSVREVTLNEGIFESDPRVTFSKLLSSESGTKASLMSFDHGDQGSRGYQGRWLRSDETAIRCRGLERSTVGSFLDEVQLSKLGIGPEAKLTIFDASLRSAQGDHR